MNEDLAQMLANLHLDRMAEILDSEVARARKGEVSYEEFLARLLRDQYHHGQEKALAARIQKAKIPWSGRPNCPAPARTPHRFTNTGSPRDSPYSSARTSLASLVAP